MKFDFKKFKKEAMERKTWILFALVVIPQILRQIVYYITQNKTGLVDFIASFETIQIYSMGFPIMGIAEEIFIGLLFISFWLLNDKLRFFTYGWLFDAFYDFVSVLSWIIVGFTPLQALGFGPELRFIFREIIFSYVIFGPLLWQQKVDIKKLAYAVGAFGIVTIFLVLLI